MLTSRSFSEKPIAQHPRTYFGPLLRAALSSAQLRKAKFSQLQLGNSPLVRPAPPQATKHKAQTSKLTTKSSTRNPALSDFCSADPRIRQGNQLPWLPSSEKLWMYRVLQVLNTATQEPRQTRSTSNPLQGRGLLSLRAVQGSNNDRPLLCSCRQIMTDPLRTSRRNTMYSSGTDSGSPKQLIIFQRPEPSAGSSQLNQSRRSLSHLSRRARGSRSTETMCRNRIAFCVQVPLAALKAAGSAQRSALTERSCHDM